MEQRNLWRSLVKNFEFSVFPLYSFRSYSLEMNWFEEKIAGSSTLRHKLVDILDYHNSKRGGFVRIDVRVLMNNYLSECNVRPFVCLTYDCCLCLMILCVRRCDVQRMGLLMESSIHMWLRMRWYSANITITLSLNLLTRSTGMFICLFLRSKSVSMIGY